MGITAQRRWRQRERVAKGQLAPAPQLPAFVSQAEHQLAIQELTKSYEIKLAAAQNTATVELDASAIEGPLERATAALDAAAVRIDELLDGTIALRGLLVEHAPHVDLPAPPVELLPEDHKRPTLEEFVKAGYEPEAYDFRMAAWENELLLGAKPEAPAPATTIAELTARVTELEGENKSLTELLEQATAQKPAGEQPAAAAPEGGKGGAKKPK